MSDRPIRIDYFSDVLCVWAYAAQIRLDELKADARFADSPLVRQGRLSVVPLTDEQYQAILELGGVR